MPKTNGSDVVISLGITIANGIRDVRNPTDDRHLSSSPVKGTAYAVWAKDKSCEVGTEDKYAATRGSANAEPNDLQALRENKRAGLKK